MIKKDFKQNFSIKKRNLKAEGNFFQASNQILFDPKLTEPSKVLLFALTSTSFPKIHLSFFKKKFGWSNDKLCNAVKVLKNNGYLSVKKTSRGYKKGFDYDYKISEFGNLNTDPHEDIKREIEEFMKVVYKYEEYFKCPWFLTLVEMSDGDPEIFEGTIKELLKTEN
jgi:hypothetical protein